MKKFMLLAAALPLLSFCVGCGPQATDTSNAVTPPTTDSTQQELEKAMEDGAIDPETYGK